VCIRVIRVLFFFASLREIFRREWHIFLTALMFFTRIPCSGFVEYSQDYLDKSSRYFPLVGWIVGATGAIVIWIGKLFLPLPLTVLLSMIATIFLTGAFHEDGFVDVCDGFGGGWTKERILEIMKDSRIGAFGAIGIVLLFALKLLSLVYLPVALLPMALIAGHSLSRFASVSFLFTHDYVREDALSKSKPLARRITQQELFLAGIFGLTPLLLLSVLGSPVWGIILCLCTVWIARWYLARYFTRWIGGYTGDCLGAAQQITEVIFYLTLVLLC
jgi:adenosylcobinamide-GDP ribazoletransferase